MVNCGVWGCVNCTRAVLTFGFPVNHFILHFVLIKITILLSILPRQAKIMTEYFIIMTHNIVIGIITHLTVHSHMSTVILSYNYFHDAIY